MRTVLAVLCFAFPIAALANISETTILTTNTALNLDTGATAASGGDILWTGTSLAPQGSAKIVNVGAFGLTAFGFLSQANVAQLATDAKSTAIPAGKIAAGDLLVVVTNSAHNAKVLVISISGSALVVQLTTYGVTALPGVPVISQVLNNSSGIPLGNPNYGIPPSSLFVIKGSGLADPGAPVLQSSAEPGLPLTLNGASITVVVNGVTTHPAIYYTSPAQIAAVLPAGTPIGTGTVTVTYKGATSPPAPIEVVPSALGINIYNFNTGVATDGTTGALLTYTNSGAPGQTIVLWTTGLGADPADSDTTLTFTPHAVGTPLQIYIGGVPATILYQGASAYPGVNQINLTIPASVPLGCWVSLVAVTGKVVSNPATLPINNGGGACLDTVSGLNGNQIAPPGTQTLRTGLVSLVQTDTGGNGGTHRVNSTANAAFVKYTGIYSPGTTVTPGGCILADLTPVPVGTLTGLDPGSISLTGPNGLAVTLNQVGLKGTFTSNLAAGAIPSSGGTFTFKGTGGADVGSFTASLTLSNPLLTWTNTSTAASIDRSQGLLVTWTGGNPGTFVVISGTVTSAVGLAMGYDCRVAVEAGQFTVPSYILSAMPPGKGGTTIQNDIYLPLVATGIDIGLTLGDVSFSANSTYK